ncbi:hypothetical protein OIU34_24900 [Pararhizobium sp. BT-229]|uniref:hypothetical protein n=1 Tax=Pararhizobium sp. BT-229 TaxID=2986923 RepID=UPI0021F76DED|nr:hypothetical protein [Pararhizobium sp. BT-229]MCV9965121.1 hypothetical protein [Pararhizobium sp. BT-229]
MQFSPRIKARAMKLDHGETVLDIASRQDVQQDMLHRIDRGEKPVTALSQPLVQAIGLEAARNDNLRRLAGEVAAFVVETVHSCIRSSGARVISNDPVFTSGQPFRRSGRQSAMGIQAMEGDGAIVAVLVAALDDATLDRLADLVAQEQDKRAAAGSPRI